jgi:AcrR family transcriptional regulator
LAPEERKALLVAAAEETFATRGYTQAGLAEVATLAGVSKTLLYHYFPDGRPELYREVMERPGGARWWRAVQAAVRAPTTTERRLSALVTTVIDYFDEPPRRLPPPDPGAVGLGDPWVVAQAIAARARLAGEPQPACWRRPPAAAGDHGRQCRGARARSSTSASSATRAQLDRDEAVESAHAFVHAGLVALALV